MPAREQQKGASKTFKKIQRSFKWLFILEKLFEHFTEYFFKDITMILHVPSYGPQSLRFQQRINYSVDIGILVKQL